MHLENIARGMRDTAHVDVYNNAFLLLSKRREEGDILLAKRGVNDYLEKQGILLPSLRIK